MPVIAPPTVPENTLQDEIGAALVSEGCRSGALPASGGDTHRGAITGVQLVAEAARGLAR